MWRTWLLITAVAALIVVTLGLLLFSDSECRDWQRAYTALHDLNAESDNPVDASRILPRTINRFGERPADCEIPELTTERQDF
jgi:hypothetical protein